MLQYLLVRQMHPFAYLLVRQIHPCAYLLKNVEPFKFFWSNGNKFRFGLISKCKWTQQ